MNWFQLVFDVASKFHFHAVGIGSWMLDSREAIFCMDYLYWSDTCLELYATSLRMSAEGGWPKIA